jgi:hypothetical protein
MVEIEKGSLAKQISQRKVVKRTVAERDPTVLFYKPTLFLFSNIIQEYVQLRFLTASLPMKLIRGTPCRKFGAGRTGLFSQLASAKLRSSGCL